MKISKFKRVRENQDFSPMEVLLNPMNEALVEELKHWDIKIRLKSEEG